ncbi:abortive phage resistance protein AbiGI [Lactococcus garvieae]|uniref:abortive phage resistance protein AbiGI n=1 Tax=Lactococcus garvieae TaxID=1363 RepID=UPI0038538B90
MTKIEEQAPELKAKNVEVEKEEYFSPKLSANALFHFMREYSFLENAIEKMAFLPRYYPENIKYLNLKRYGEQLTEWWVPMTCFCDIPLHQISHHAEGIGDSGYGKFGIALNKKFGIDKGIQPIQYLNENSVNTKELSRAINALLSGDVPDGAIFDSMSGNLLEHMRMVKPLSGTMPKTIIIDGKSVKKDIKKNFHDEHEWRYIPNIEVGEAPLLLVDEDEILAEKSFYHTDSLSMTKNGLLYFNVDDIRYIFVANTTSRNDLIKFIQKKRTGRRLNREEKDILISKIIVYDDLKEDW